MPSLTVGCSNALLAASFALYWLDYATCYIALLMRGARLATHVSVVLTAWLACWAGSRAHASGASPYLPLHESPEIERAVERVMILGGQPVLTRPIPVANVLRALPVACRRDAALCARVRRYLDRYFGSHGVTHASAEAVLAGKRSTVTLPNERGERMDSNWDASVVAFYRPGDHVLLSLGADAYGGTDRRVEPTGSLASFGNEYFQLDAGYRDHWFSPLTDTSALVSTEAPSIPSVTLSNQQPFTPLGLQYEFFVGEMSYSNHILWQGKLPTCAAPNNCLTAGHPRLGGVHVGIEPISHWALSGNAVLQYGGGARPGSLSTLLKSLLKGSVYLPLNKDGSADTDARLANRAMGLTSAYTFDGPSPFSAYVEYTGRDSFHGHLYGLHETDLSAGLHFPELFKRFDLTLEATEWQKAWYADYVWLDGLAVDGDAIGIWGADWRTSVANTSPGAHSVMAQLGVPFASGDALELRYRWLANASYEGGNYRPAHMVSLEYAQPRDGYTRGLSVDLGRDVFGHDLGRLGVFARFDGGNAGADTDVSGDDEDASSDDSDSGRSAGWERFVDVGASGGKLKLDLGGFKVADETATPRSWNVASPHLGFGVREAVSKNGDLGVRAEFDDFKGLMIGLRVLDYRYRLDEHLALGLFAGVARYAGPTPAQGYYAGAGLTWRDLMPRWDLSLETRFFDHIQRDKLLPSDQADYKNGDPLEWYLMQAPTLYLSRRF